MNEIIIILAAGLLTGITTIMFGFGGGFVVVPFVYHLVSATPGLSHEAMHIAVATSTAVMVVNSGYATIMQWRAGGLLKETVLPMIYFIAAGALGGALLSLILTDRIIRVLFILYMLLTLMDCVFRRGFLDRPAEKRLSGTVSAGAGLAIGAVAAMLGVGGSVMTVPLLRRHGYAMKHCVSAANPLSLPVALAGSAIYAVAAWGRDRGLDYIGFINLKILGLLIIAGFSGIWLAKKCIPPVNDALHAGIYVGLLAAVLLAIAL
ncbi:sulfite exporter TauE/SafE family protein [Sodalis sp. RH24]|uniref:sulfite exporter TauE/SafE family protein n=1 Tax=unclassified Sodalis (in: enterobacteria) TaxID=2636512 RepID=UPI0039B381C5